MKVCKYCGFRLEGYTADCDCCGACESNGKTCNCELIGKQ